ncbi:hypothetical protein SODG_001117 [Sodalis praecaptivus]
MTNYLALPKKLFVALVGNVLDTPGLFHQFLSPQLKPIDPGMVILGRAMPVLEADYFQQSGPGNASLSEKPFGLMFHALDDLQKMKCTSVREARFAMHSGAD